MGQNSGSGSKFNVFGSTTLVALLDNLPDEPDVDVADLVGLPKVAGLDVVLHNAHLPHTNAGCPLISLPHKTKQSQIKELQAYQVFKKGLTNWLYHPFPKKF